MNKVKGFWDKNKDTIKNVTIAIAVPVAILALYGVRRLNRVIDENNLNDLFYGDEESEEEAI